MLKIIIRWGDYREINLKQCWIIICWVEISSMTPKRVLTISRLASKVKEALFFIIKELSVRKFRTRLAKQKVTVVSAY